jgi:hypothetical protein
MERPMNTGIAWPRQRLRASLSNSVTTVIATITVMTFSASGAPTPLYHQYQESFG